MVIHQEIFKFLNKPSYPYINFNNLNYYENIKKKILKLGKEMLEMLYFLLGDKDYAEVLAQDFFYLSAKIRNHQAFKTTSFVNKNLDIYHPSCLNKTKDLIVFIINELQRKYDFSEYNKQIQIIIKNIRNRIKRLNVKPTTTIQEIKNLVNCNNKYDHEQIIFIYKGEKLKNENTIEDLGIKQQDIIYLVITTKNSISFLNSLPSPPPTYNPPEKEEIKSGPA